jgi:hypothetical protein
MQKQAVFHARQDQHLTERFFNHFSKISTNPVTMLSVPQGITESPLSSMAHKLDRRDQRACIGSAKF